jgi:hypothetical protein
MLRAPHPQLVKDPLEETSEETWQKLIPDGFQVPDPNIIEMWRINMRNQCLPYVGESAKLSTIRNFNSASTTWGTIMSNRIYDVVIWQRWCNKTQCQRRTCFDGKVQSKFIRIHKQFNRHPQTGANERQPPNEKAKRQLKEDLLSTRVLLQNWFSIQILALMPSIWNSQSGVFDFRNMVRPY